MFRRRPKNAEASGKSAVKDSYSFFGEHQSGISTDAQDRMYFAALTLKTTSKDEIKKLLKNGQKHRVNSWREKSWGGLLL